MTLFLPDRTIFFVQPCCMKVFISWIFSKLHGYQIWTWKRTRWLSVQFYKKKSSNSTTYMLTSNRTILRVWHKFHKVIWYLMQWIELIWWHKISRADVTDKIFVDITKQSTSLLSWNFQSRIWIVCFDIDVYFNVLKYHLQQDRNFTKRR